MALYIADGNANFNMKAPPFTYMAIELAGPMYVGRENGEEGSKVWICLFTCCVTRAIHLELVRDIHLELVCDMPMQTFI